MCRIIHRGRADPPSPLWFPAMVLGPTCVTWHPETPGVQFWPFILSQVIYSQYDVHPFVCQRKRAANYGWGCVFIWVIVLQMINYTCEKAIRLCPVLIKLLTWHFSRGKNKNRNMVTHILMLKVERSFSEGKVIPSSHVFSK